MSGRVSALDAWGDGGGAAASGGSGSEMSEESESDETSDSDSETESQRAMQRRFKQITAGSHVEVEGRTGVHYVVAITMAWCVRTRPSAPPTPSVRALSSAPAARSPRALFQFVRLTRCFMYRYISLESCSQFDSLPLTYLTIHALPHPPPFSPSLSLLHTRSPSPPACTHRCTIRPLAKTGKQHRFSARKRQLKLVGGVKAHLPPRQKRQKRKRGGGGGGGGARAARAKKEPQLSPAEKRRRAAASADFPLHEPLIPLPKPPPSPPPSSSFGLRTTEGECSFRYRYILRASCSQFDSLPLTYLRRRRRLQPPPRRRRRRRA